MAKRINEGFDRLDDKGRNYCNNVCEHRQFCDNSWKNYYWTCEYYKCYGK